MSGFSHLTGRKICLWYIPYINAKIISHTNAWVCKTLSSRQRNSQKDIVFVNRKTLRLFPQKLHLKSHKFRDMEHQKPDWYTVTWTLGNRSKMAFGVKYSVSHKKHLCSTRNKQSSARDITGQNGLGYWLVDSVFTYKGKSRASGNFPTDEGTISITLLPSVYIVYVFLPFCFQLQFWAFPLLRALSNTLLPLIVTIHNISPESPSQNPCPSNRGRMWHIVCEY